MLVGSSLNKSSLPYNICSMAFASFEIFLSSPMEIPPIYIICEKIRFSFILLKKMVIFEIYIFTLRKYTV